MPMSPILRRFIGMIPCLLRKCPGTTTEGARHQPEPIPQRRRCRRRTKRTRIGLGPVNLWHNSSNKPGHVCISYTGHMAGTATPQCHPEPIASLPGPLTTRPFPSKVTTPYDCHCRNSVPAQTPNPPPRLVPQNATQCYTIRNSILDPVVVISRHPLLSPGVLKWGQKH